MELKIYSPQEDGFAQIIQWNFLELKKEIAETVQGYETSVYTDDTMKQAKADRAKLRKFVDALETKRKEIKKKYLVPYEQFERQEQELVALVQKAIDSIDGQVKSYEERLRAEKTDKIREFYEDNIYDMGPYLPFDRVMKPEYANASTSMKSIREEILAQIQKVSEGIAILNSVESPYAADMKEVFLRTYDLGAAMAEQNRLEAAERKRREYEADRLRRQAEKEAREKEEARRLIAAGRQSKPETGDQPVVRQMEPSGMEKEVLSVEDTAAEVPQILDFRVYVTREQMIKLRQFLKDNGIRFEPVPKQ